MECSGRLVVSQIRYPQKLYGQSFAKRAWLVARDGVRFRLTAFARCECYVSA